MTVLSRSLIASGRFGVPRRGGEEREGSPPPPPPPPPVGDPLTPRKDEAASRRSRRAVPRRTARRKPPLGPPRPRGQTRSPDPKSQSLSRGYGSVLPTSLTYILLSARGFSPWRPAAVMSTAGQENDSLPLIFKGRRERTEHFET